MHRYTLHTVDVALVATVPKTLLQLVTPATRRAKAKEIHVSFNSVTTSDAPVLVELMLQTTAGANTALVPTREDQADPAALCSAAHIFTVEPAASDVLRQWRVSPVGGLIVIEIPDDVSLEMLVSTRLGLRLTAAQAQAGVRASLVFQE